MLARVSPSFYAKRMSFAVRAYTAGRSEGSVAESRQFGWVLVLQSTSIVLLNLS